MNRDHYHEEMGRIEIRPISSTNCSAVPLVFRTWRTDLGHYGSVAPTVTVQAVSRLLVDT